MRLLKNDKMIRQTRFNDVHKRRKILTEWFEEVKPNGTDYYEISIILD